MGSGIRNINKYLKVYSGGEPEFYEDDIFRLIVLIKKHTGKNDGYAHQDTHQDKVEKLRKYCENPRSRIEMQEFVGLKDKINFKKNYLIPMLEKGIIKMTIPDKPTSRNQKYVAVKGETI